MARKTDLVFGAGELFAELANGLVGFEVGISLGHGEQTAQAAVERLLGRRQRGMLMLPAFIGRELERKI